MAIVSVRIPQLGEGLQEARVVEFLKNAGDAVKKDEPIYEIETDKAITEIESPYEGTLINWTAEVDSVLEIGAEIGTMEVAEGTPEMGDGHEPSAPAKAATSTLPPAEEDSAPKSEPARGGASIPPRTRKLLKEKNLLHLADQIPAAGSKLMPEDVERFIAAGGGAEPGPGHE